MIALGYFSAYTRRCPSMRSEIREQYESLTPDNQALVNTFIEGLYVEQTKGPNKETLEAIREVENGQTYKFDTVDQLMDWIDKEC